MQGTDPVQPDPNQVDQVGRWQVATIESIVEETYRAKTFRVSVPVWPAFRPGQHVDIRLTAPDGYQAQRSYSIASAPESEGFVDLMVELVQDGEVSGWFHSVAEPGDTFELRGPIGGPFTWTAGDGGPLLLIAGGSGVVPLMSMLRHGHEHKSNSATLLLYSSRSIDDVVYRAELESLSADPTGPVVFHTLTRGTPPGWQGFARRVDRSMIDESLAEIGSPERVFVCGPTAFVEAGAASLIAAGVDADRIRTERFGPSG